MKRILGALLIASALISTNMVAKYICVEGLEGEGSFTEVYKNKEECRKYCRGGAVICEEAEEATPVNLEEVD